MVNQPALFNLAAANFYRSTEAVARQRAESGSKRAASVAAGDGASLYEPGAVAVADEPDENDPFGNW
jgi:hypothetical protein